jgi:putative hydrolase of the HAD superfamily
VLRSPVLPVEAAVFDLGGVLVEIDFDRVLAHWAKCARAPLAAIRARFRLDDPDYLRHERGELDLAGYFATLRRSLGIDIPDDDFAAGWRSVFVREIPGVRTLLGSIEARAPLYVFSNTNPSHHETWTREYAELLRPFRKVFASCELGKRKPTPEAFHAVAQAIDVPPEHILFFDDTPANVAGALAVGMQAVHVGSPGDIENAIRNCHWSTPKENA